MKKYSIFLIVFLSLLLFGCSNKKAITYNEFKKISEREEYTVVEVTEQFSEYDYIKGAYLAVSPDANYQVELYLFEDQSKAKDFYELTKSRFENGKKSKFKYTSVESKNYSKYTLTTENKYNTIARIDNTVVYSICDINYNDNVIKLIKKLGY